MAPRKIGQYSVLFVLFLITIVVTWQLGEPSVSREPGIKPVLPESAGLWRGSDIHYCHNHTCLTIITSSAVGTRPTCPSCKGQMHSISLSENNILPEGTFLRKRQYHHPRYGNALVSLVIAGDDRGGIHKPQWCLAAQGYSIVSSEVIEVPVHDQKTIQVMTLSVRRRPNRDGMSSSRIYGYWFIGNKRETPHNRMRLFWSAFDSIFLGVSQRWAYLSIMLDDAGTPERNVTAIRSIVQSLLLPTTGNSTR